MSAEQLAATLRAIDGRGYKAYKDIAGRHAFEHFELRIDHVQADPFAPPSRARVLVPRGQLALPDAALNGEPRRRACRDFLARALRRAAGGTGELRIDAGAQTVLDRSCVLIFERAVELRFTVALPARGRTIDGRRARHILCEVLPEIVARLCAVPSEQGEALEGHCAVVEDQVALRAQLAEHDLVGFVADGARLARRSGVDDRPLNEAIPFAAPASLRVALQAPNAGAVPGMGIPAGITLIVGGGFHGKSTLLNALELGIYDHVPGDGRDAVVARGDAVKIRAEDGRAVHAVDLSPFIDRLPYGKPTHAFETGLASGSTSQAAALQEALEAGAGCLLVDEDTSATNFMIRDERMQALVARHEEPITPFVDRIRELRQRLGVSTLLVMGGSGDYFPHADRVVQMHDYLPRDVTAEAHRIAEDFGSRRRAEAGAPLERPVPRRLVGGTLDATGKRGRKRIKARGTEALTFGDDEADLRAVAQLVDPSQGRGIGRVLELLGAGGGCDDPAAAVEALLARPFAELLERPDGDVARPRRFEVLAALNRLRRVRLRGRAEPW